MNADYKEIANFIKLPDDSALVPLFEALEDSIENIRDETRDDAKVVYLDEILKYEEAFKAELMKLKAQQIKELAANEAVMKKLSDLGKSSMADCISCRKALLEGFAKNKDSADWENCVPNLIFPADPKSNHNLWIIDENLSYYRFLASDNSIPKAKEKEKEKEKEKTKEREKEKDKEKEKTSPVATIFDSAFALVEDPFVRHFSDVAIIAFKRPGTTDKNCVDQVMDFIDALNEQYRGKYETADSGIRFNCHIIADISDEMSEYLWSSNFKMTPEGLFYTNYGLLNANIEVVSYSLMLNNAMRRNIILYDQLVQDN
ncbi:MAG: hypothetical protein LBT59_25930 [Clostridiales bacterium]|jgi:hypothetical protein|nr:hypothetical protein [Clostridiales bacterium]